MRVKIQFWVEILEALLFYYVFEVKKNEQKITKIK